MCYSCLEPSAGPSPTQHAKPLCATSIPTPYTPATVSDQGDSEPAQGPLEEHGRAGHVEHSGRHLLYQLDEGLPVQRAGGARAEPRLGARQPALVREHAQVSGAHLSTPNSVEHTVKTCSPKYHVCVMNYM